MIHFIQRIIVNTHGWTSPSPGRLGRAGEGKYVKENGFGHEDWNFNFELAVAGHIYGYAYYTPSPDKLDQLFNIAFVTYAGRRWRLVGFYLRAEFAPNGAPTPSWLLTSRRSDLLALQADNSLGKPWTGLDASAMRKKLKEEARGLRWRVSVENALSLPAAVPIPKNVFSGGNYRITTPTLVTSSTFNALRALGKKKMLPDEDESEFPEGRERLHMHKARERSAAVVKQAKEIFLQKHGKFFCQACGFDFAEAYGSVGTGFIEAHHTIPVSQLKEGSSTKVTNIALVCANCHRMLHRRRPWLSMKDLTALIAH